MYPTEMTSKPSAQITLAALLLGWTGFAFAQPIIYESYRTDIFYYPWHSHNDPTGDGPIACYSNHAFKSLPDMPTTAQYLAMFSDKFVEHKGKVFTVKNAQGEGGFPNYTEGENGLYEVSGSGIVGPYNACVQYHLLYEDNNIGQIVASSRFDPIEIIGVDSASNRIYGYYQDSASPGGWERKRTAWGYALDGSLVAEPVEDGEAAPIAGVALDDTMFSLWGDFNNFNFSNKSKLKCAGRPAIIGDWSGNRAGSRGNYCPGKGNNQLKKYTWHGSGGSTADELSWEPASKIARLGPKSNIYGVSSNGNLLVLWNDSGNVRSAPLYDQAPLENVRAVGGLDDGYARGIFASNDQDRVYNVYWRSGWKSKEIPIDYYGEHAISIFFGNHGGKTYLLYVWDQFAYLYRLNFVGGTDRYEAELLQSLFD